MAFIHNLYYYPLLFLDNPGVIHNFLYTGKISSSVTLQSQENKSGAGADPHPVWI